MVAYYYGGTRLDTETARICRLYWQNNKFTINMLGRLYTPCNEYEYALWALLQKVYKELPR